MPVNFRIDPERDAVMVTGSGTITMDELLQFLNDLATAGSKIKGLDGIVDASRTTDSRLTFDNVRRISDIVSGMSDLFKGTRWAIVAPDDAIFGTARMYETLRTGGPFEVRTFRTAGEAEAWVGRRDRSL